MFRSQTSDNMDRWKAEMGRVREKRRAEERRSEKRKSQKKEDAGARKGRKVAKHCDFPMMCGSGGSKSRLAKAAGAEPSDQMRDEKLHAVVARSTFRSQNVQNTPGPDHFWKLRCRKSARCCGAKHILKSKCSKHQGFGPLLEAEMSKKCTPLCREAHFQVKMLKTPGFRTTFGGSDSFRLAGARDCAPCQQWAKRAGFVAFSTTTTTAPHYTPTRYTNYTTTTTTTTRSLHSTTLHYATLHYTQLHSITQHHTTLHYTTLRSNSLHYITLHYITIHYTPLHYNYNYATTFHYTPLHSTTLNFTTLHYTTLHYIPLHYTTLPLHYTTLHSATLHYTNYNYNYNNNTTFTLRYTTLRYTNYTTLH